MKLQIQIQIQKNDISFYIDDEFKQNPDVHILKTFKNEYGNLLKQFSYEDGKNRILAFKDEFRLLLRH